MTSALSHFRDIELRAMTLFRVKMQERLAKPISSNPRDRGFFGRLMLNDLIDPKIDNSKTEFFKRKTLSVKNAVEHTWNVLNDPSQKNSVDYQAAIQWDMLITNLCR